MKVEFTLPMKVFSINQMNARDARFKTAAYKAWAQEVLYRLTQLDEYKLLLDMASDFNSNGGAFKVKISATYPPHVFYNKQGAISAKTVDCTNFGKPLLDLIFGDTMQVNDKNVIECTEAKSPGAFYSIIISIDHGQF